MLTDVSLVKAMIFPVVMHGCESWTIDKTARQIIDAEKDWGKGGKGATGDEMVGWQHQLNAHEFEQTSGDSEGQASVGAAVHGGVGLSQRTGHD